MITCLHSCGRTNRRRRQLQPRSLYPDSQQYFEDALYSLTAGQMQFSGGWDDPGSHTSNPPATFRYFRGRTRAMGVDEVYDYLFYGKIPFPLNQIGGLPIYSEEELHFLYLFLMVGLPGLHLPRIQAGWEDATENA